MRINQTAAYATNRPAQPMRTYASLYRAYKYFDRELFGGVLPPCIITLERARKAYGYFSPARFINTADETEIVDEIAMNPAHFAKETPKRVLSTLAHEMAHLWQFHFGKPGRGRYHNREWARKMHAIGLFPSDTGKPGGKPTGDRVSHYIVPGGRFQQSCTAFLTRYTALLYQDRAYCAQDDDEADARERQRKASSKTRYVCPACRLHAWANPGARLRHADCDEDMLSQQVRPPRSSVSDEQGPNLSDDGE